MKLTKIYIKLKDLFQLSRIHNSLQLTKKPYGFQKKERWLS